jgi:hypothetical protein
LKVSRPYITRLVALGLPTTSIADAKRWLQAQKKASGCGKNAPASINAARIENILLRNQLLRLEIAQAEDTSELVSVERLQEFIKHFYAWTRTSLKLETERLANQIAGQPEIAIYGTLGEVFSHNLFNSVLSYMAGANSDSRLLESARGFLKSAYLLSDAQIEEYIVQWATKAAKNL